jgi:PAS domain S-box-containing protein
MAFETTGARLTAPLLEELWPVMLQVARAGLFVADSEGQLLEANPRLCESLGVTRQELLYRPLSDWLKTSKPLKDCIASPDQRSMHACQVRGRDGAWHPYNLGLFQVASGGLLGVVEFSPLTRTELALQESEFFLQRSQAVARIGSYRLEIPQGLWIASPGLDDIFGIVGDCRTDVEFWNELVHPEDREEMLRYFQEHVLAGRNRFDREYRIIRRNDGEVRWVHGLGELEFDPQGLPLRMIGTIQDITERKQTQEALRQSEERYRLLFDSNPQPMWVHDWETLAFLNVNEAAIRKYGYSREEFMRMTLRDMRPPEDVASLIDHLAHIGEGVDHLEVRHRRKDGSLFDVEIVSHFLVYEGRKARLALANDITERRRSEAVLRELEQQLFQAQKMEAIGRLAGGVAHDFNNHLTVIIGYCQMILAQLDPLDPLASRIQQVLRAGDQSARLTQQLLAFSRKQILQPKTFCPNEVITDTVHMLDRVIGENIQLTTLLDPALGAIQADPGQISQVLMNLTVNARDAMPRGGTITLTTANLDLKQDDLDRSPEIKPGAYVLVTVSDNGAGMDKATLDRIFEPFFTTKAAGAGTGLGLAMVYGIVRQSGGAIAVNSEAGQGTTFKIYFPRVAAVEAAAPEWGSLQDAAGGDETILVVEDNQDLLLLTTSILEGLGYRLLYAANGAEALTQSANYAGPIQLMITDVVMPGMTGGDLAHNMAKLRPAMKVLFISGYTANVLAPEGILAPGIFYLPKPFTPTLLAEKVRGILTEEQPKGKTNAV